MSRARRILLVGAALLIGLAAAGAATLPGARVLSIVPQEGMVKPGQPVRLTVEVERPFYDPRPVRIAITRGLSAEPVATLSTRGGTVEWTPSEAGGYGVVATLGRGMASTAVDVGDDWTKKPRYGFFSDFSPSDAGQADRLATMAKYHLNGIQFYDWMYRHSNYIPPTDEFVDPLGRTLSKTVVLEKIDLGHKHGMAAMAYTAIYGAPKEFYEQHKEWALYTPAGQPFTFGDGFLYIMNPEKGSPWFNHMVSEYGKIVREMPFDGIHLDQYGDPKSGFRYPGKGAKGVNIATAIVDLINATKAEVGPGKATVFNDVGGWPLADTAPTANDFIYIEVWPPNVNFDHLAQLISEGKRLSGGKPVVLAAYINPEYEPSVLLADATIFANGGYHLELGEGDGILADPYFPKYKRPSPALAEHLRRYYDVSVRYQDLLYASDLERWEPEVTVGESRILPGGYFNGVWPVGRRNDQYHVLSMINLNGLEDARWAGARTEGPTLLEKQAVTVTMEKGPKAAYLIDPDGPDQSPVPVPFTYADGQVRFTLDRLHYWAIIAFEL